MIRNKSPDEIKKILELLTLSTERITLRHINTEDLKDVYAYASDDEVTRYLTWYPHIDIFSTQKYICDHMSKDVTIFGIVFEGKVIGSFDLRLVPEHEKASFGYVLNRNYWGQGIMTEVLGCMMKYCFNVLQLNRMESTHYAGNTASRRVMQKCGFIEEGFIKQELVIKGKFVDVYHFGITRDDYLSVTGKKNCPQQV